MTGNKTTLPHHRYRLNDFARKQFGDAPSISVGGVILSSDWKVFFTKQDSLLPYIKTYLQKDKPVDYQQFVPATGEVIEDPAREPEMPSIRYTGYDLAMMTRSELQLLCQTLNISPVGKTEDMLRRAILDKMNELSR